MTAYPAKRLFKRLDGRGLDASRWRVVCRECAEGLRHPYTPGPHRFVGLLIWQRRERTA